MTEQVLFLFHALVALQLMVGGNYWGGGVYSEKMSCGKPLPLPQHLQIHVL